MARPAAAAGQGGPRPFVLDISPPQSVVSFTLSSFAAPPFQLTFHDNEPVEPPGDEDANHDDPSLGAKEREAQRRWLIDTHRVWRSIAETAEAERRDERWIVPYDAITISSTATTASSSSAAPSGEDEASDTVNQSSKRQRISATAALLQPTASTAAGLPAAFQSVLSHSAPSSSSSSGTNWRPWFRRPLEAVGRLHSFDDGFFGRFIQRVQQHNTDLVTRQQQHDATPLHLLIGGSAPLAATCRTATFTPNDIDLYVRQLDSRSIRVLHGLIEGLVEPAEQALVVLRKPLTLTWVIHQRKRGGRLVILHRLQLNLLYVHSWAEVFSVYHSDVTCAGFDVLLDRFVVLYDRWRRFYDIALASSPPPSDDPSPATSHGKQRTRANEEQPVQPRRPLYFSNFLNLDSPRTLAGAARKYRERGFTAVPIELHDAVLQPGTASDQLDRQVQHPLGGEMEMSQMARGKTLYGVKLDRIPVHDMYGDGECDFLDRDDVVGWLVGLCLCRLYKVAVCISDVLLPDDAAQPPHMLFLRWVGSLIPPPSPQRTAVQAARQPPVHSMASGKEEKSDAAEATAVERVDGFDLTALLSSLGLTVSDVPWHLAAEFNGRYGAGLLLAPLLLSLADCEYRYVFELRRLIEAAYEASAEQSKRTAATTYWPRALDDDPPTILHSQHSGDGDDDFSDLQYDDDVSDRHRALMVEMNEQFRTMTDDQLEALNDNDHRSMRRQHHRERGLLVPLNAVFRYGFIQLTRALLHNGSLSADRLSTYFPWVIRFFQAKYIRYRRTVRQLLIDNRSEIPLLPELASVVADYV